jgi:hypothetical protein
MMRLDAWLGCFSALVLLWHECGENPAIFCYRIGSGSFTTARSRALVPVLATPRTVRNSTACSNSSATFSTPSTMSRD